MERGRAAAFRVRLCNVPMERSFTDCPVHDSRTYDDDDQGEVIRHGFEPADVPPADSPGSAGKQTPEGEQEDARPGPSAAPYGDLDDGHVWSRSSPRES